MGPPDRVGSAARGTGLKLAVTGADGKDGRDGKDGKVGNVGRSGQGVGRWPIQPSTMRSGGRLVAACGLAAVEEVGISFKVRVFIGWLQRP